mgnify:CR=1 FL=1
MKLSQHVLPTRWPDPKVAEEGSVESSARYWLEGPKRWVFGASTCSMIMLGGRMGKPVRDYIGTDKKPYDVRVEDPWKAPL